MRLLRWQLSKQVFLSQHEMQANKALESAATQLTEVSLTGTV